MNLVEYEQKTDPEKQTVLNLIRLPTWYKVSPDNMNSNGNKKLFKLSKGSSDASWCKIERPANSPGSLCFLSKLYSKLSTISTKTRGFFPRAVPLTFFWTINYTEIQKHQLQQNTSIMGILGYSLMWRISMVRYRSCNDILKIGITFQTHEDTLSTKLLVIS